MGDILDAWEFWLQFQNGEEIVNNRFEVKSPSEI